MIKPLTTKAVACSAPYGGGGLGQHFTQIVETARQQGQLTAYYSGGMQSGDACGRVITVASRRWLPYTPLRYSPGWLNHLNNEGFDLAVAAQITPTEEFEGFGGQSLHSFRRLRRLGCQVLHLQAANSHIDNVFRQHHRAIDRFGLETTWLNAAQRQKTLREYDLADIIHVASDYTRQTFLAAGFAPDRLRRIDLKVRPRFTSPPQRQDDGIFRVVYVGSLTVMKGIPLLLEAFSQLPGADVELILVGGWATRGMRHYLQSWLARDQRIKIAPGDPLPHLHRASVYVHPTYEDGFAYAPMEALACGVPVIVTEDTGMKEHVKAGVNGYIVPTGNWEAILERLITCRTHPLPRSLP